MIAPAPAFATTRPPESRAARFAVDPTAVLRRLARRGAVRFVTGNGAVRVEGTSPLGDLAPSGRRVPLGADCGLWLFLEHWDESVDVIEPGGQGEPFVFRFFHKTGGRVLEISTADGSGGSSLRATLARWRATGLAIPESGGRDAPAAPRPTAFGPGMESELARARKHGATGSVQALVQRHGLSRIEALSLVGAPWAERVVRFGPRALLERIADRRLGVQLLVGNEGLTFARAGTLPAVQCEGRDVLLREPNLEIKVRSAFLESLWAVRLRSAGEEISSIESYDPDGNPALLIFGAPGRSSGESAAWRAFADRLRSGEGGRDGAGIRGAPNPRARRGRNAQVRGHRDA